METKHYVNVEAIAALNLTELESRFLTAFVGELYAEAYFSDVDCKDVAKAAGIPIKQARGVLGSLIKKGIVYVDRVNEYEVVYLEKKHFNLHKEWFLEIGGLETDAPDEIEALADFAADYPAEPAAERAVAEPGPVWAADMGSRETFTNAAGVSYSDRETAKDFEADDLAAAEDAADNAAAGDAEAAEPAKPASKRPDRNAILDFYHAGDLLGLAFDAALRNEPTSVHCPDSGRIVDALEVDRVENVRRRLEDMLKAVIASARDIAGVADLRKAVEKLKAETERTGTTPGSLEPFTAAALDVYEAATRRTREIAIGLIEIDEFPDFDFDAFRTLITDITGADADVPAAVAAFVDARPFDRRD